MPVHWPVCHNISKSLGITLQRSCRIQEFLLLELEFLLNFRYVHVYLFMWLLLLKRIILDNDRQYYFIRDRTRQGCHFLLGN